MRKRIISLIFVLVVFSGYIVHDYVWTSFVDWSIKKYCQSCLQADLAYTSLQKDGNKWMLDHPTLATRLPLNEGGYHMAAESVAIESAFSWDSGPLLTFVVAVESPKVSLGKEPQALKELVGNSKKKKSFIGVQAHVLAKEGIASLEGSQSNITLEPVLFNIDFNSAQKTCAATFHFGDSQGEIKVCTSGGVDSAQHLDLLFDNIACEPFIKFVDHLFPNWTVCRFSDGLLKGKLHSVLPLEGEPSFEGRAVVRNLAFCHPTYEGEFHIPEVSIETSPEHMSDGTVVTRGQIDISRSSTITFAKEGKVCWAVEALAGGYSFQGLDRGKLDLEAMCRHGGDTRLLRLQGEMEGIVSGDYNLQLNCRLHEEETQNDAVIHLVAKGSDKEWKNLAVDCVHLTKSEFDFVQNIVKRAYPQIAPIDFKSGTVDLTMKASIDSSHISEIQIQNLDVNQLNVSIPQVWAVGAQHANGSVAIDCSNSDPLKTLRIDLGVENAHFSTLSHEESAEGSAACDCRFSELQGHVRVQGGKLKQSFIEGMFIGLKGRLEIDDDPTGKNVRIEYEGNANTLSEFLPECIRQKVNKKMSNETFKVIAQVKRSSEAPGTLQVNGSAFLIGQGHADEKMSFGMHLNDHFGFDDKQEMPGCWWSVVRAAIKDGWFEAENVSLEKFVSPFIFQQDQIHLSGKGIFRGTFDNHGVLLQYDAQDMVMENSDFCMELKSLSQTDGLSFKQLPARYFIDFTDMNGKGSVPVCQGTYFEKNSGLLFTDVNAVFNHEEGFGRMAQIEAFCNGIYFNGQVELDWSQPGEGVFDVDIKAHEMLGKMSQMQQLCSHFNKPLFFLKIPLEGNLAFRAPGGHLHFAFKGSDYDLHARIEGALTDGVLMCPNADMTLQEIGLNFSYDHIGNTLDFFDMQGTLLVGKPNHVEEYAVVGDRIHFTDYANDEADFDVWVGDRKRDILRLAGKTRKVLRGSDGEPMLSVMLDHSLSHFGDVYPSVFQLTLKEWSQIESLKLVLDLQIKTLLSDLQRFSRTGLMFLSRSFLKGLNNLKKAEGGFNVDLSYDGERSLFKYELSGNDIVLGQHKFQKFLLNGNKRNDTWSIEQLQLDDISLAADLLKQESAWKVNFLGARVGDALLAGLEGQYLDDVGKLEAKINLLEVDLAKMQGWPALKKNIEDIAVAGQLRASGALAAEFNSESPKKMSFEIELEGALRECAVQGLCFQDIENASLHYKTGSGLTLKNIRTALKGSEDDPIQAGIYLQKVECNFSHKEFLVDKLFFHIPSKNLEGLVDNLQRSFPQAIKPAVGEAVRSLKYKNGLNNEVQGALTFELSEPHCALRLSLDDGIYEFMGKEHDVKGFVLEYDPFELKISSIYKLQQEWLSATIRSTAPGLNSGEIVILDNPHLDPALQEYFRGGFKPLTVRWQIDPEYGFYIDKLEGRLRGVSVDLSRDPFSALDANSLHLTGQVYVNMREANVLFDSEMAADLCSWDVGNGYSLHGLWVLDKASDAPFSKSIAFNGSLQGREFEFFGYQFSNLSAQVSYERGFIWIQNVLVSDSCGSMHIAESKCVPLEGGLSEVKIPFLVLNNFKPGLLRPLDGSFPSVGRSLTIGQLEIQEIHGFLGNRNSFKGRGRLAFVNPPRKNLQPTIFAIPAELLTRIGLDLAVLTPVRGAVYYRIDNGRVLFTKFKDIYSKGRLSKFYLPNNGYQSSVDFDGNLDLQVRMKQYNLVFKLAELFTVNVQGSLSKPTYSLNKQQK